MRGAILTDKHRCRLLALLMAVCWAAPGTLYAHADIDARVAALDKRIAADLRNGELYLKRAELHRLHQGWDAALVDYQRAERLAPDLEVVFYRGRMWLDAGRLDLAKSALDRFLSIKPNHANALRVRARVLAQRGDPLAAADDLSKAIARFDKPTPDLYLERAQLLASAGSEYIDRALRGLDQGIARFGPIVTLIQRAVDLERKRGRHTAALARIDALPDGVKYLPTWMARRGDILAAAGHHKQARHAYAAALNTIEKLNNRRRSIRAVTVLEARLRQSLAEPVDSQ